MSQPTNPAIAATERPAIIEALGWLKGVTHPDDRPLINLSQAAPVAAPPLALREALADMVINRTDLHLYGPDLGLPVLRDRLAADWSLAYGGRIDRDQVAITAGCNQAFAAAIASLATHGDEVILPTPWYFNHKMWLQMSGIRPVPLPTGDGLIPDAAEAEALITERTRAIVLVSPNNPAGAEYPADTLRAFYDLAKARGLALIVDETYRDFDSRTGAPHDLFSNPDWDGTLIHLYSFSKAYRLTGHRVGAIMTSPARLLQVEKFIDSVTICPNQIGQHAALWGMEHLSQWLAGERAEILTRRAAVKAGFEALDGWTLKGLGAYFAYVEHPHPITAPELCKRLVSDASLLMLPATMFTPDGDPSGPRHLRIAFANADTDGLAETMQRLAAFSA